MTLRDFKEVFISKACSQEIKLYFIHGGTKVTTIYDVLSDFYDDDYCDDHIIDFFKVDVHIIFISLKDEVYE